ncbi:MAG TPA: UDP-3-O-(3-hydroxymyristoyl)glucosamine N-acyltransferase [Terriglobales bacterium]|jgi:UDP-3-O-[3-hydroxymyristoyl] glucosamine N-acyltransferase
MPQTLQSLAEFTATRLIGDGNLEITTVASIAQAQPGALVFVQDEKRLAQALDSPASAVIAGEFAASCSGRKPLLIAEHPRLAFARAGELLHPPKTYAAGVHPTAVVHASAKVAASAAIDAYAVIEAQAVVGERSHLGAGCCIGEGVVIGDDCDLYPRVVIYPGTTLGRRVVVHAGAVLGADGFGFVRDDQYGRYQKFPQIGELVIGDYVEIGANCTIDRGALETTVIGAGTKLDNLIHIGHNVTVGANVVIAAQTGVSGSVEIGDGAVVGGQVGIGDHATVEPGVILGSGSGVLSNKIVRGRGVVFWGRPARPLRRYLKELAALARLARKAGSRDQ